MTTSSSSMTPSDAGSTPGGTPTGRAPSAAPRSPAAAAHRTLLPYALTLIAASAILQTVIAVTGNRISLLSMILLAVIALGYATYLLTIGRRLSRVRYGLFAAHAISYAAINVGYLLHAYLLIALRSPTIAGDGGLAIDTTWFGATFGMAGFWGLGLLIHGLGAVLSRGFEQARA